MSGRILSSPLLTLVSGLGSLLMASATVASHAAPAAGSDPLRRRPNILFILADDLGYGDLGCYGQKQIHTPNLDRMASEGMRFPQCYAGCPVCAPSRCTLMTGRHTGHCTLRTNGPEPLRPEDVTVADVLRRAGYTTGLIGKWGLGPENTTGTPNLKGFDYFFGYLRQVHAHNYYPDYLWKNEVKVPVAGNVVKNGIASQRSQYSQDLFTQEALTFLEGHRGQPFFLYLAYTTPHANNERGLAEGNGMEVPTDAPYSDRPWPQALKNYAAMVTRLDADIGRVLSRLRELGLEQETIVFFSSDNGPAKDAGFDPAFFHSAGPLRGLKADLYEGGIRVPMIARWPGKIRAGAVSDLVWAFWDFLPTAAELAGAKAPSEIDGISVAPTLLERPGQKPHEFLYWEFDKAGLQQALRMGDWKAFRRRPGAELEIYNLKQDIDEKSNVAALHPRIVGRILDYLQLARTDPKPRPNRSPGSKGP